MKDEGTEGTEGDGELVGWRVMGRLRFGQPLWLLLQTVLCEWATSPPGHPARSLAGHLTGSSFTPMTLSNLPTWVMLPGPQYGILILSTPGDDTTRKVSERRSHE